MLNSPLQYYWVVWYENGNGIAQFDPDTGMENLWKDVRQDEVIRVAWVQFSKKLSRKIKISTKSARNPKIYSTEYNKHDKIFICRRNHINISKGIHEIEYVLGKNGIEKLIL